MPSDAVASNAQSRSAGRAPIVFAFAVTMLGTTLPTPLYPIYERTFELAPILTPIIFASYAGGLVAALLFFGYLSDEIGRRRMMIPALVLSAVSACIFLFANGLAALLVGRVVSGLSAGIASGTATSWIVDLAGEKPSKKQEQRATMLAVATNIGGLALGPLLAGAIARASAAPLRFPFVLHLALLVPAIVGIAFAPETVRVEHPRIHLRIQKLAVAPEAKEVFRRAAIVGICGFAVSGVFSAIAPAFLGKSLHHDGPLSTGLLVCLFFGAAVLGQLPIARLSKRVGLGVGCAVLVAGLGFLAGALVFESTGLLLLASGVSGLGQGMTTGFGLAAINEKVGDARAETDSTYFLLLYLGVAVPVVAEGFAVLKLGMVTAGLVFCGIVATLVLGVLFTILGKKSS